MVGPMVTSASATPVPTAVPVTTSTAAPPTPWQNQYALPDWQKLLTKLPPPEEKQFQTWATTNKVPVTTDYDMRGFWKAYTGGDPRANTQINPNDHKLHFSDVWKTPLHKSFSGESLFANPKTSPPMWNDKDQLVAHDGTVIYDERTKNAEQQ